MARNTNVNPLQPSRFQLVTESRLVCSLVPWPGYDNEGLLTRQRLLALDDLFVVTCLEQTVHCSSCLAGRGSVFQVSLVNSIATTVDSHKPAIIHGGSTAHCCNTKNSMLSVLV